MKYLFNINNLKSINNLNNINYIAFAYLLKKIDNIKKGYLNYNEYLTIEKTTIDNSEWNEKFLKLVYQLYYQDNSHITLKIRQTINFLLFNNYDTVDDIYNYFNIDELEINIDTRTTIEFQKIYETVIYRKSKITDFLKENSILEFIDEINFLPPPIFDTDFIFENESEFSALSSGEKQKIYSINSILYHLINLNSVHDNSFKDQKYKHINIVFDEVELYAHPEMQRTFINNLLQGIKKLDIPKIEAINILFVTHSPFILSDIPKQNILYLKTETRTKNGQDDQIAIPQPIEDKKSFGANITDLLADSFFIDDGLIGDFAKKKIKQTIKWLNGKESTIQTKEEAKKIIEIIDEPVLKYKLREMYFESFPDDYDKEKEIEEVRKRAIELGIIKK